MKRFKRIVVASVVSVSLLSSGLVFGQGWGNKNSNRGQRYNQQQQVSPGPGRVLRAEMFDARAEVLADLSGQSVEEVKSKLQYKPMWAVADEYNVDFSAFQTKMHEKAKSVVKQALADEKVTQEQADAMLKRMENGPYGPGYGKKRGGRGFNKGQGRGQGMGRGYNANPPSN